MQLTGAPSPLDKFKGHCHKRPLQEDKNAPRPSSGQRSQRPAVMVHTRSLSRRSQGPLDLGAVSGGGAPSTPCTEEATEAPAGALAHGGEALALLLGLPGPQTPHCLAAAAPVGASSPAGPSGAEAPSPRLYSFSATHLSTHLPIAQGQRHSSNDSGGLGFRSVQSAKHWAGALHAVWRLLQGPCNVPELL